ncbi:MAG: phosphopantothenoylcysteine decarboxylase [Verrucomicrobiota bacterium]
MRFLITAGPTREPIDPVRYISNRSSGKMGYAIAQAALESGHEVVLVSGPVAISPPAGAHVVGITTGDEMFDAVQSRIDEADALVMCAAVADFKPAHYSANKIKKQNAPRQIDLVPARDILASITRPQKNILIAGFAAETESLSENAQKKLREKQCDVIIGNDVSRMDTGLESDDNELVLFFRNGETRVMPRENKILLARKLIKIFEQIAEKH